MRSREIIILKGLEVVIVSSVIQFLAKQNKKDKG